MSDETKPTGVQLDAVLRQVSGQLRQSLGNIGAALERLAPPERREEDPELDRSAAVLLRSYYRILRLSGNLAEAAALEEPSTAQLVNDDIVGFCREMVRRAEHPAALMGLRLAFRSEKVSHIIAMDAERMERLVMNLLSNAFKFTPAGGEVVLEVRVVRQWVELRCSDTGCGIPRDRLETVYERYHFPQQADPPPYGLGLGLPICRRIAWEHGGSLLINSEEGRGTTVTLSLPNTRARKQALHAPVMDYAGGYNRTLLELSDALPREAFGGKYMD